MGKMKAPETEAEAAEMEQAAAKFRREQAEKELAEKRERLEPLRELVESEAWETVREQVEKLAPDFVDIDGVNVHLSPLPRFMGNLRRAMDAYAPPKNDDK